MNGLGRARSRTHDMCVGLIAVMGIVLLWSRLANLGTSFWGDEAYSAFYYSDRGPHAIFFSTWVPNNHVLFNLLNWITTRAVGQFEAADRFWSVVPGLAAVALAAWWLWKRVGPVASAMVVVLATVSPVHLVLTPQARGYGLAMLAGVAMLVFASRASDRAGTRDVTYFAISAIVGIWTLPVFAVAAGAQALMLLADRALRRATLIACGVIAAASLVFYAPMLGDIAHNADQEFGSRLPLYGFITGPYKDLARPTIGYGIPLPISSIFNRAGSLFVLLFLLTAAAVRLFRRRGADRTLLAHLFVPVFLTYVVFVAARFFVQPRFASYLLFHVLVLLAIGVQQIWDLLAGWVPARVVAALLIAVFAVTGTQRVGVIVRDQARVPWENSRFVAQVTKSTGIYYVFTNSLKPGPLYYYLGKTRVIRLGPDALEHLSFCRVGGRFIFVDDQYHRTGLQNVKCLMKRGALKIQVPQQLHPPIRDPGVSYIYVVPAVKKG